MDLCALLQEVGCKQIETTRERFLNDGAFYLEITEGMLQDPAFEELGELLKKRDVQAAFDMAHMLKGIAGNCGLTSIFELLTRIVEPLRTGKPDFEKLQTIYEQLIRSRNEIRTKLFA